MDQSEEAMDRSDWESVRDHSKVALGLDPENPDALAFLASVEQVLEAESSLPSSPATIGPPTAPKHIPVQPTSFANGRYQVERFLGEGGKKKVYLAQDTLLDREVAFALIKTDGLDEVSRTRITREAQAMGRLGSHPHIVTVFDLGDHEGQPYMVTELMGGGDVEGVIEDALDHRLPLEQAIDIAKETCRGLEFAHSRGIAHRGPETRQRMAYRRWRSQDWRLRFGCSHRPLPSHHRRNDGGDIDVDKTKELYE